MSHNYTATKLGIVLLLALLAGCKGVSPTAPLGPPPPSGEGVGHIWGTVWEAPNGVPCIVGATLELLDGARAGERFQQSATDCAGDDGTFAAFTFRNLPNGTPVRVRASMPGFISQEQSVKPSQEFQDEYKATFILAKSP